MISVANEISKKGGIIYVFSNYGGGYIDKIDEKVRLIIFNKRSLFTVYNQYKILKKYNLINYLATTPQCIMASLIIKLIIRLFNRTSRIRLVVRIATHQSSFIKNQTNLLYKVYYWLIARSINYADRIIVLTKSMFDDISIYVNKTKVDIVKNPTLNNDIKNNYKNIVKKYSNNLSNYDKIDILVLGRLAKKNNILDIIKIMKKLVADGKYDYCCKIIGAGDEYNNIKKEIEINGLTDNINLLGSINIPYEYLLKSDYYFSTSIMEGSPNALIEAMYFGNYPIVYDCPGGPKDIIQNNCGDLIEIGDIDTFCAKFYSVLEKGYSKQMIHESVKEMYDINNIVHKYIEYFKI